MSGIRHRLLLRCFRAADLAVMAAAFGIAFVASGQTTRGSLEDFLTLRVKLVNVVVFAAFVLLWYLTFRSFGLYRPLRSGLALAEWWNVTRAVTLGTLLLSGLGLTLGLSAVNRVFLGTFFIAALPGTLVIRAGLGYLLAEARPGGRYLRNLVIVGCGRRAAKLGREVRERPELGYLLLGYVDEMAPPGNPLHEGTEKLLGPPSRIREILGGLRVDEVVISLPIKSHYDTISEIISLCREVGITVRVPADFFEPALVHAYSDDLHDTPMLTLRGRTRAAGGAALKRLIDVAGSALLLLVASPVLALLALAIKIDSRGPVLFVQERVGMNRRNFEIFKLRTMRVGAEQQQRKLEPRNEASGAAFKIRNDPRVTRVGRVLRKLSLDELPQLWNVLRGDMSLVGPRPLPVRDVKRLENEWSKRRLSVKPGLTCLWQISGRHEIDFDDWMDLDLQYIDNWSLSLDLDILVKTLPAVVGRHGAS